MISSREDGSTIGITRTRKKGGKFNARYFYCILLANVLLLVGCQASNSESDVKEDDVGVLHASIDVIPFESLQKEADLIVEVKMIEKVGEVDKPTPKSIFELEVENIFKGSKVKPNERIRVSQLGNSGWVYQDNDFILNKELSYILFLKETVGAEEGDYWILNEDAGLYVLNEDAVIKLVDHDEELNDIVIDQSRSEKQTPKIGNHDKESIQLLNKEKFLKRITDK